MLLYQARRKLAKLTSKSKFQGAQEIYINDNLTKTRKILLAEVRKRKLQNQWHSTWTIRMERYLSKWKEMDM